MSVRRTNEVKVMVPLVLNPDVSENEKARKTIDEWMADDAG